MNIEAQMESLGLQLPAAPAPAGSYIPALKTGSLLYLSGAICMVEGAMTHTGKVGEIRNLTYAQEAAKVCALNLLAAAKQELGSLDRVTRIVCLNGFINGAAGFSDAPLVMNAASELMLSIFGENGKHTRAAVTVAGLPKDSTVEIQAVFEVSD